MALGTWIPESLIRFLPDRQLPVRFTLSAIALWLVWFVLLGSLTCTEGCSFSTWGWAFAVCFFLSLSFACFGWALAATACCISKLLSRNCGFAWVGEWPRPIGVVLIGCCGHLFSVAIFQLLFAAVGAAGPLSQWYLGFLPWLVK